MRDIESLQWLSWLVLEHKHLEAEPQEGLRILRRLVLLGNAAAMVELAFQIDERDRAMRTRLLERAVSLGRANAMVCLAAELLVPLEETPRADRARAERLLQRAATRGQAWALMWLGWKRDFVDRGTRWKEAVHWYGRAARRGITDAMHNYAICLECGLGVKRNVRLARKWFVRAAERGDTDSSDRLAQLARRRFRLVGRASLRGAKAVR